MPDSRLLLARLNSVALAKVRSLETDIGGLLVAFESCQPEIATIPQEKLTALKTLEQELDAVLVAYRRPPVEPANQSYTSASGTRLVNLSESHVRRVEALEAELGVLLLLYQAVEEESKKP